MQNLQPDSVDTIGGNPHAEDPVNHPRPDWRTDPDAWVAAYATVPQFGDDAKAEKITLAHSELSALVDGFGSGVAIRKDLLPLTILLAKIGNSMPRTPDDSRFVRFGPVMVPTSPRGLDVLRLIRQSAQKAFERTTLDIVEPDSTLGRMMSALHSADLESNSDGLGLLQSSQNATNSKSGSFNVALDFHSRAMSSLPKGSALPSKLLSPSLVGFEVSDLQELAAECDMCSEGLADFLRRFDVDFEESSSTYECDQCGGESELDEGGEIESCDTFTLTEEMVDQIDTQGFGEKLRAYIGAEEDTEGWEGILSLSDSEILERSGPVEGKGIAYDPEVWCFDPDYEELPDFDGFDDMETADVLRMGSVLASIVRAHAESATLPPIPGTLHYKPMAYERTLSESGARAIRFAWEPDTGRLQSALGGGLSLRWDTLSESATLILREKNQDNTVPLTPRGSSYLVNAPHDSGGTLASILVRVQASTAEV